jgi:hypothetical protein
MTNAEVFPIISGFKAKGDFHEYKILLKKRKLTRGFTEGNRKGYKKVQEGFRQAGGVSCKIACGGL